MDTPKTKVAVAASAAAVALSAATVVYANSIPDRVSIEKSSPFFWPSYKKLGVRIDGEIRRRDVVEFCVSEGWAMVQVRDSFGRLVIDPQKPGHWLLTKVEGAIEPYWIDNEQKKAGPGDAARLAAAEAKRQRKAAKLRQLAERQA